MIRDVMKNSSESGIETLGFSREGKFENRIRSDENGFEADIPLAWFNPNFKELLRIFKGTLSKLN